MSTFTTRETNGVKNLWMATKTKPLPADNKEGARDAGDGGEPEVGRGVTDPGKPKIPY